MTVALSLLAGAGFQFFNNDGVPLAGGLLYTYQAGTTTPANTYTTIAGNVANSNPIVMDAYGRPPQEIWLTNTVLYKFVLKTSAGVLLWTQDNIPGVLGASFAADLANTTDPTKGDALVGFRQSNAGGNLTGAVGRTVHQKLQEVVSVKDFGAVGDGVTNDSAAFQLAVDSGASAIYVPAGTYLVKNVNITSSMNIYGDGFDSVLKSIPVTSSGYKYSQNIFKASSVDDFVLSNLTFDGDGTNAAYVAGLEVDAPLIWAANVVRTKFSNLKVTKYNSAVRDDVASTSVYNRLFEAVIVRNTIDAEYVKMENIFLTDNYFEQIDIWNGPDSECVVTLDHIVEYNTDATPTAHTACQNSGGHFILTNSYFYNTGATSRININVTKTSLIDGNSFIKQIGGVDALGPSLNFGQDGMYGQNNCTIVNNYFEDAGAGAITHSGGSNILIVNNTMTRAGLHPIDVVCDLNTATFNTLYPDFPVPTLGNNYTLHIINNAIVGAQNTTGPTGRGIWFGYVVVDFANIWYDVIIKDNVISMDTAPYDTNFCIFYNGTHDVLIKDNYFNYKYVAIYSADWSSYVTIEGNTFGGNIATQSNDIDFAGDKANKVCNINNNRFAALPLQAAYNISVLSSTTFDQMYVENNVGMKPKFEVSSASPYLLKFEYGGRTTAVPSTGIFNIDTVVNRVPASAQPMGWITSSNGCFATFTATASGTAGNYTLTVTDGTQFKQGQYIQVTGVGSGGASKYFVVCRIVDNVIDVDAVVETTASAQTVTAVNPTFVTMPSYA